jgi:hypothetical protein
VFLLIGLTLLTDLQSEYSGNPCFWKLDTLTGFEFPLETAKGGRSVTSRPPLDLSADLAGGMEGFLREFDFVS